jgi:hypothetical protein
MAQQCCLKQATCFGTVHSIMAENGFHTIGRWVAAAACAGVLALALAPPAFGGHAGFPPVNNGAFAARAQYRAQRDGAAAPAVARYFAVRRLPGAAFAPRPAPPALNRYRSNAGRVGAPMVAAAPGTFWRVGADARTAPRTGGNNVYMRAGSIRADIARYNEEHGANRFMATRPANADQRPPAYVPDSSVYRN